MDNSERRSQELDQLELDAKQAGRTVKTEHLGEGGVMSEDAQVSFATALAQLYLQKHLDHLEASDITFYMLLYLRCFKAGYKEVQPEVGKVSYSNRIY